MNNDDDSQRLFNFVTVYGLKPDAKDPNKLTGTLVHCYPQPSPGNEPHAILSEFCFPDIESRTAPYRKEQLSQPPTTIATTTIATTWMMRETTCSNTLLNSMESMARS